MVGFRTDERMGTVTGGGSEQDKAIATSNTRSPPGNRACACSTQRCSPVVVLDRTGVQVWAWPQPRCASLETELACVW